MESSLSPMIPTLSLSSSQLNWYCVFVCAGGEDSLSSTPADTHSPSHGRGPVGADSETDNSHTEKRNSATGGDTGTATVLPPSPSLPSFLLLTYYHYFSLYLLRNCTHIIPCKVILWLSSSLGYGSTTSASSLWGQSTPLNS